MPRQRQQIGQLADPRERHPTGQLDRPVPGPAVEVELDGLREAGQVIDAQHRVVLVLRRVPCRCELALLFAFGVLEVGRMGAGRTLTIPATNEHRFFFYLFSHASHSTPALLVNARSQSKYRQIERNQDSTYEHCHYDQNQRFD